MPAKVLHFGRGDPGVSRHSAKVEADQREPLRIRVRQWPQQYAVGDAEDGDVGADPEPQDEDGHGRESWTPAQRAQAIPQVLHEVFDASCSPHVPALLFDLLDATERTQRGVPSLLPCHSRLDVVLDLLFEMEAQLFAHLVFQLRLAEQCAQFE